MRNGRLPSFATRLAEKFHTTAIPVIKIQLRGRGALHYSNNGVISVAEKGIAKPIVRTDFRPAEQLHVTPLTAERS